jgi:RHS repeat-associated protein
VKRGISHTKLEGHEACREGKIKCFIVNPDLVSGTVKKTLRSWRLSGKNLSVKVVQYHHDGNDIAVEYRPSSLTWTYFLGRGLDDIVMRTDGTNRQYFYKNGLGSIVAVANNSGVLQESYEYNLQGQVAMFNGGGASITSTGISNDHLYTGRQLDPETGDYYYRARYYSPILGRFISRDPLSGAEFSQGSNLYAYCLNNGANFNDPSGMCPEPGDPGFIGPVQPKDPPPAPAPAPRQKPVHTPGRKGRSVSEQGEGGGGGGGGVGDEGQRPRNPTPATPEQVAQSKAVLDKAGNMATNALAGGLANGLAQGALGSMTGPVGTGVGFGVGFARGAIAGAIAGSVISAAGGGLK